jgi:CheY-like chemotaxis protein
MMAQLLTLEGYQIETVANGCEALAYLNDAPRPDVILLDLMMPIMDGWAFCRSRWRSRTLREIPVILISAVDMSESNRPTGIDAFLPKPIDVDEFARLAARMAGRKTARPRSSGVVH